MLARYRRPSRRRPHLRWIGYLSSTVVYGDRGGGWVDEDTPPAPSQARGQRRLDAETAWARFADRRAVDIFRLAGIYGPGRSAFDDLRAGRARRMIKPGHEFGRIHRDDIAAAVLAAMRQDRPPGRRILNLADDEPAETAAVVTEAAALLGWTHRPRSPSPTPLPAMSPMARSFWAENRKVASQKTKAALEISWLYPTFGKVYVPSWSSSAARVCRSNARSAERDSRWSPSLTRITRTSGVSSCSAIRRASSQGTSGSAWPCSRRTGQRIGIFPRQHQMVRAIPDQAEGDRGRLTVLARHIEHAIALKCRAFRRRHRFPHQALGEIRSGGDADQCGDPLGAGQARSAARSSRPWRSRPGPTSRW